MNNSKFAKLIKRIGLYPPYLGAGVRLKSANEDFTRFDVELREHWYNRNLFGTHFGGTLYSMSDPFYLFIVVLNLGPDYIVWDKSASIEFLRPARGTISGVFEISTDRLEMIRAEVDTLGKNTYRFETSLTDDAGETVARIAKEVYVRSKAVSATTACGNDSARPRA